MRNLVSILFYLKKSKMDSLGKTFIYLRITVDGKRCEKSIRRKIHVNQWNSDANCVKGLSEEATEINRLITTIRNKIYQIEQNLIRKEEPVSAKILMNHYIGINDELKTILSIFQEHNDNVNSLIGRDFAPGTAERYKTAKKHLGEYVFHKYKKRDLFVKDIDYNFIIGFEYYLKTKRKCGHNSAVKYITNFKKIIRIALANGWIKRDPFLHWTSRLKPVHRAFLSEGEIQTMMDKKLHCKRLEQVRDIFIFCCFTGLAYIDIKNLTTKDIGVGIDGEKWILSKRTKTHIRTNIPLLPTALLIIKKYENQASLSVTRHILPVLSNQKMNAYLKEISDLCGINKNLTFHLARHTFATTITLTNGVPIETVSKMLGHTSLKTTQHYAKILDSKVSKDMEKLKAKFT